MKRRRCSLKINNKLKETVEKSKKYRYFTDFIKESIYFFLNKNWEWLPVDWVLENRFSTTYMIGNDMYNKLVDIKNVGGVYDKDISFLVEFACHKYFDHLVEKGIMKLRDDETTGRIED